MKVSAYQIPFVATLVASLLLSVFVVSLAQESESTDSATKDEDTIKEVIQEQVNQRIDQILNKPVGVFGKVTGITDANLTIVDTKDETSDFTVVTSSLTKYENSKGGTIERKEIALEDTVLVKGVQTNMSDRLEAEEVQVINNYSLTVNETMVGSVEDTGTNEITIDGDNGQEVVDLTRSHGVFLAGKIDEELDLSNLNKGDEVLLLGYRDDKDDFIGKVVLVTKQVVVEESGADTEAVEQ